MNSPVAANNYDPSKTNMFTGNHEPTLTSCVTPPTVDGSWRKDGPKDDYLYITGIGFYGKKIKFETTGTIEYKEYEIIQLSLTIWRVFDKFH